MSKIISAFLCFIFAFPFFISAQDIHVSQENSHDLFIETLKTSKDVKYQEVLLKYDKYISLNPDDVETKISRCKFIGGAYYDEYEDYDLNYEETSECIEDLYTLFPSHPSVIIYRLENLYGEEREVFLKSTLENYNEDKSKWNYKATSQLFKISSKYYFDQNDYLALSYAERAERFSDSLDLSILISNIHLRLGNKDKARESILSALYMDSDAWDLNAKGNILIELGEYEKALSIFGRVKEKDSTLISNQNLHKVFLGANKIDLARSYLVKDTIQEWDKLSSLQKLLEHDIKYSDSDTAFLSYRRLQKESFYDDFLGIKRLKLFFKAPLKALNIIDLLHLLLLVLCIVVLFVIPYLWILPIYAFGKYLRKKTTKVKPKLAIDWTLKHFWGISFFYLLSQIALIFVFYYQDYINFFFEISFSYYEENISEDNFSMANSLIFFSSFLALFTTVFLNKKRISFILSSNIGIIKMILLGILFVIGNGILLKTLNGFLEFSDVINSLRVLAIREDIGVLMTAYGFTFSVFLIAIIVPFSEEIIFRGIILSSSEKHLGFVLANIIQALLFATVHFNLKLFIYYFAFGLITGYAVKKTNGLLTGIVFHAINNFFVLLAIYFITKIGVASY